MNQVTSGVAEKQSRRCDGPELQTAFVKAKVTQTTFVLIRLRSDAVIPRFNVIDNLFALRVLSLMFTKSQQISSQSPPSGLNISGKSLMPNWWLSVLCAGLWSAQQLYHMEQTKNTFKKKIRAMSDKSWVIMAAVLWLLLLGIDPSYSDWCEQTDWRLQLSTD